ncbi:DNA-directed RNA polymerase subunit beta [Thermosporothrix hazakensis]|jgi:DNA-directed RNA polymerase subunit beta|uniref:DNA-directed RNA polymerase subunit beta n=2 Tax=Thermosporothrix TaxID=768650 RepID=A0A326U652_THEHA|nr:DNA-directed RNA polymerase subunit beta [Thermosporothrix hazakensis]PZW27448.1 DNA-directed RNA polymerase subunit beta [Thermosporothrix hazakensis]BBH85960.1 DNA-directed RNA polymerase subunit beta [Thermosporothrix sp. COM3]GCE45614.1 DNA-directed RNA polymerase subunit beta [Thermosporothrix hazakensis]
MAVSVKTPILPERVSFARIPEIRPMPNLIQIQIDSFEWFKQEGLKELFEEISPIEDFTGKNLSLEFIVPPEPFGKPKYSEDECRERDATYAAPLTVKARLINKETGEIIEKDVFMGDFPLMTKAGTFIINGAERVVVSQLVRSPGVYYTVDEDATTGKRLFAAKVIPNHGAWLEFETSNKNLLSVKIDRKRKIPVTTLLRAIGSLAKEQWHSEEVNLATDQGILDAFAEVDNNPNIRYIQATLDRDPVKTEEEALLELYKRLRPGDPATLDNARSLVRNLFFNARRYDLGKVGRYKLNRKLDLSTPQSYRILTLDDIVNIVRRLIALNNGRGRPDDIDHLGNRRVRSVGELIQAQFRVGLQRMERVVKERMSIQEPDQATPNALINIRPVVASIREFFGGSPLSQFMDQVNVLSEIDNKRRLSAMGPGGLSRERASFEVRDVHSSHYGRICPIETSEGANIGLISNLATYGQINDYGFIETPYRKVYKRIAANDRRLIGHELQGIYGREREDIVTADGEVLYKARTPVRVTPELFEKLSALLGSTQVKVRPFVTEEIEYHTADDEENFYIAQANAVLTENNEFAEARVLARYGGDIVEVSSSVIDYMDVSPRQTVSVASALIPCLEHDDVNRALMGANMQRQAVPLLRPQAPIVGTGIERQVAIDSGQVVVAEEAGEVVSSTAKKIEIIDEHGKLHTHVLRKYARSNNGTCINQRPIVKKGDYVSKGQVIADNSSTEDGELALGQNILVAFMSWEGGNFEDAILISERIVREDLFTSIHIDEYETEARDTKLGPEEITRDIPNVGEEALRHLDERGIVYVGAEVGPQDILVGKITPKGETELTAEEKLLRAIFGEKAREVKDTSLRLPHGEHGKVISVKVFSRQAGDELSPGVNQVVRVSVAQKRKIGTGDKMAGRHGNKGVISRVLPVEDMPFLPDGTPVDIILNPLGVPHRMNIGQIMETHLGWAAHELGLKVATPVFDGATEEDIIELLKRAGLPESGKVQLYDGRTGEPFDHPITVGYTYMLKLAHLVEDKVHARSTGPYSLITQQPLGGKAQFGGQRFGEMEVWALEAYGAAHTLQEILTVKSDDTVGRVKTYEAIVKGEQIVEPGVPESFKVLVKELQALAINVEVLNEDEQKIQFVEDTSRDGLPDLGINLSGFELDH